MSESIFGVNFGGSKDSNTATEKQKAESKEEAFWYDLRLSFAKYLTKSLLEYTEELEYAKPLSILEKQKIEIATNKEDSKMISQKQGGPTKEEIYASALALAKALGAREKAPMENTQKVSEEEIANISKEKKEKKTYTNEELGNEFSKIQNTWEEAYEKMENVNGDKRTSEILDLTAKAMDDWALLETYMQKESENLKPEEKFFIEISIQLKKYRTKGIDLLIDDKIENENTISYEDFKKFVDTGVVSEDVLKKLAQKIMEGKQISKQEISIYSEKSKEIENIIKINKTYA